MNKTRLPIRILCITVTMFLLTSCGLGEKMPETAEDIVNTVMKKLSKAKELDADLSIRMDMGISGQSMAATVDSEVRICKNPTKVKTEIRGDLGNGKPVENVYYMEGEEEVYHAYTKKDGEWKKTDVDENTIRNELQSHTSGLAEAFLQNNDDFTIKETVEEEGRKLTVLEGRLPIRCLNDLMNGVGLSKQMGMDYEQINQDGLTNDIFVTLWVDRSTVTLYQLSVDLSEFMEMAYRDIMTAVADTNMGGLSETEGKKQGGESDKMEIKVERMTASIRYDKFSAVEDFEIPSEVKNAAAIETSEFFELFGMNGSE